MMLKSLCNDRYKLDNIIIKEEVPTAVKRSNSDVVRFIGGIALQLNLDLSDVGSLVTSNFLC